jgi:dTMP kinase
MHNGHNFPGKLIAVEGLDGSGKSTQIYLLKRWMEMHDLKVFFTEWNSSLLVKDATRKGKKRQLLTPTTFCLVHATDFADRYERQVLPLLRAGYIVLADRYIYTAFARDVARGCDRAWVRDLYKFAVKPTAAFYFRAPLDVAIERIASARPQLKFYEAGMDMGWSDDEEESFKIFQGKILDEYDSMRSEFGLTLIDATQPIHTQQRQMREIVGRHLRENLKKAAAK